MWFRKYGFVLIPHFSISVNKIENWGQFEAINFNNEHIFWPVTHYHKINKNIIFTWKEELVAVQIDKPLKPVWLFKFELSQYCKVSRLAETATDWELPFVYAWPAIAVPLAEHCPKSSGCSAALKLKRFISSNINFFLHNLILRSNEDAKIEPTCECFKGLPLVDPPVWNIHLYPSLNYHNK